MEDVWLWAAPRPAFAQHGGGGHASGGGHPGGGAPASHPGGAASAAHPSASSSVVSTRTSVPSASAARAGERGESGSRSETGQRGDLGEGEDAERGGADATPEPAPHVVYGGYGYFVRENESAPAQHYTASSHIWQEPASRPPTNVTLPSNSFTAANHMIAAPTQPAIRELRSHPDPRVRHRRQPVWGQQFWIRRTKRFPRQRRLRLF